MSNPQELDMIVDNRKRKRLQANDAVQDQM